MTDIHPQLRQDCFVLGRFPLCHLLLMNDRQYPWFILVPDRDGISEIHQLNEEDRHLLCHESNRLAETIQTLFQPDKINIASLGNMVPQLHIHHVARFRDDACWPKPVWGQHKAVPYSNEQVSDILEQLREALAGEAEITYK